MRKLFSLSALLMVIGCASPQVLMMRGPFEAKKKDANIEVFQTAKPQKPYVEIAQISCGDTDDKYNLEQIKVKAREVGADAIIITGKVGNAGYTSGNTITSESYGLSSVAIKYTTGK